MSCTWVYCSYLTNIEPKIMGTINEESSPWAPSPGRSNQFGSYPLHRVPTVIFIISQSESSVSCLGVLRSSQDFWHTSWHLRSFSQPSPKPLSSELLTVPRVIFPLEMLKPATVDGYKWMWIFRVLFSSVKRVEKSSTWQLQEMIGRKGKMRENL